LKLALRCCLSGVLDGGSRPRFGFARPIFQMETLFTSDPALV
jgi:hypothetical protein